MLKSRFVANAYQQIAEVQIPEYEGQTRSEQLGDLPLVRSVHPDQLKIMNQLCSTSNGERWKKAHAMLQKQKDLRNKLYDHVDELNHELLQDPNGFIFPDSYSLLLWIWTFQLFHESYLKTDQWVKFYYRGEARDYGETQFLPLIARDPEARLEKNLAVRIRRAVVDHMATKMKEDHERLLLGTMSCSQILAVAQHYGLHTPLLDVTTNPEVAFCFATKRQLDDSDIGIIGYAELPSLNDSRCRDLALVVAPYWCSRIHAQSGFFLATTPEKLHSQEQPFLKPLRFRRNGQEGFKATWIQSSGSTGGNLDDLYIDPEKLSAVVCGELPVEAGSMDTQIYELLKNNDIFSKMKPLAIEAFNASAKNGILEDGRRHFVISPCLLQRMMSYAPIHMYLLAVPLLERFPNIYELVQSNYRAMLTNLVTENTLIREDSNGQKHSYSETEIAKLDGQEIMKLSWELINDPDSDELPWPLNSWVKECITETSTNQC